MQVLSTGKTGQEEGAVTAAETEELRAQLADARARNHDLEGEMDGLRKRLEEHDRDAAASRHKRKRPSMLSGRTMKMDSPLGDLYVTINEDDKGKPFEVFCTLGKAGGRCHGGFGGHRAADLAVATVRHTDHGRA